MRYPDTVRLATTESDGYGDKTVTLLSEVPANFVKRSGFIHGTNTEGEASDAAVYLQHTHEFVLQERNNLEGMYVQTEPFTDNDWYRISSVNIAERKLLDNAIVNIYCRLQKAAGVAYVYNS